MQATRPNSHIPSEPSLKRAVAIFSDWMRYLVAKKRTLFVVTLVGLLIGTAAWLLRPTKYTAYTTFVAEGAESGGFGLGQFMEIATVLGMNGSLGDKGMFDTDNISELYKSRRLLSEALFRPFKEGDTAYLLIDRFVNSQGLSTKLLKNAPFAELKNLESFTIEQMEKYRSQDEVLYQRYKDSVIHVVVDKIQKKHLKIGKPDRKLEILRVDIISTDEAFSKRFNEELVNTVNQFYITTRTQKATSQVALLEEKVDSVRRLLDRSIHRSAAVADATPNLNPTRQVQRMVPVQQAQFDMEINVAVLEELVKNLEMAKLSLNKEVPLIEIIDAPIYPLERDDKFMFLLPLVGAIIAFFLGCIVLLMNRTISLALNE
jgi:hypothetical protein